MISDAVNAPIFDANWDDLWFSLPNLSPEREALLAIARANAFDHGHSLLAKMRLNTGDGLSLCRQLRLAGVPIPTDARALLRPNALFRT